MLDDKIVQTALTLVWSALGVLGWIFGSKRGDRLLWGAGAVLMGVVLLTLLPIVGIPFVLLGSRTVIWLMAAPALMQVVSAVAVAGITSVLSTSRRALVAGIVVLGLPGAIASARSFVFAGTAGAMLALAVWALVSSDRGRRTSAMIGFGGAVGLMLLARTMTVAFLPALVVAAATYGARDRRVVRNVALAGAACCAVAAPWWWVARERISDNLLRYGYSDLSGSVT